MKYIIALVILMLIPSNVLADDNKFNDGKIKAKVCMGCHGKYGISDNSDIVNIIIPNIGGQNQMYLIKTITDYQVQTRKGHGAQYMYPMVGNLSDQDINDISYYFSRSAILQQSDRTRP